MSNNKIELISVGKDKNRFEFNCLKYNFVLVLTENRLTITATHTVTYNIFVFDIYGKTSDKLRIDEMYDIIYKYIYNVDDARKQFKVEFTVPSAIENIVMDPNTTIVMKIFVNHALQRHSIENTYIFKKNPQEITNQLTKICGNLITDLEYSKLKNEELTNKVNELNSKYEKLIASYVELKHSITNIKSETKDGDIKAALNVKVGPVEVDASFEKKDTNTN